MTLKSILYPLDLLLFLNWIPVIFLSLRGQSKQVNDFKKETIVLNSNT